MLLSVCAGCGKNNEIPEETAEPTVTPAHTEYELTDNAVSKEETVFINLAPDGSVRKVSVSDKLHTAMPQVRVEDKSDLKDITDVKTYSEPVYKNDRMFWDMDGTDLYYSGVSEKEPPLDIRVSYRLDGKDISYSALAGKSGDVSIDIEVENKLTKTVKLDGKSYTIECPMLFLCGMILPDESFDDVKADKGVVLGDGAHKLVAFMGVPGMNESLGLNDAGLDFIGNAIGGGSYNLTAKAENFALGNIMFVAVPFSSVRTLGFKDISVGVDGFKDMLTDIEGLLGALSSLELDDMIQVLYGDAAQVEKLINAVGDAAELYEKNKGLIEVLNKYITEGNLKKLEKLLSDMENIDVKRIKSLTDFTPFNQLMELLGKLNRNIGGIAQLTEDYLGIVPVIESLNRDLEQAEIKNALDDLPQTIEKLRGLVDTLRDSEELLNKTVKLFSSDSMKRIKEFTKLITDSASLDTLTAAQSERLAGRMRAWLDFGESYDIFTQRTKKQSSSVVFVYKMEAVG